MIGQSAICAFTLRSRPQRALHEFTVIQLTDRRHLFPRNRICCETAFYATEASIHDVATALPAAYRQDLQNDIVHANMKSWDKGLKGAIVVLLTCEELNITHSLLICFDSDVWEWLDEEEGWKRDLINSLNEGLLM
ncbi:hypothetical protein GYMLUDRAFT_246841 [Collybiopsis luxurians FD-317 M1]|uniref:Uncharacterized protein n=1 Tax=Collybiopsis luxurians FD-317 M1 TaxID=944289 RepID=A0A0D0B2X2_9AGAR|nr:hypothetical protein GYMLUDRAFT_246841 [Collybiopsis luxurians FD-317 M1]